MGIEVQMNNIIIELAEEILDNHHSSPNLPLPLVYDNIKDVFDRHPHKIAASLKWVYSSKSLETQANRMSGTLKVHSTAYNNLDDIETKANYSIDIVNSIREFYA